MLIADQFAVIVVLSLLGVLFQALLSWEQRLNIERVLRCRPRHRGDLSRPMGSRRSREGAVPSDLVHPSIGPSTLPASRTGARLLSVIGFWRNFRGSTRDMNVRVSWTGQRSCSAAVRVSRLPTTTRPLPAGRWSAAIATIASAVSASPTKSPLDGPHTSNPPPFRGRMNGTSHDQGYWVHLLKCSSHILVQGKKLPKPGLAVGGTYQLLVGVPLGQQASPRALCHV